VTIETTARNVIKKHFDSIELELDPTQPKVDENQNIKPKFIYWQFDLN
jgi:hypothetical protein